MKYITKEVRIGIAGIAALCILVYGINYLKGINMFKPSSYFYSVSVLYWPKAALTASILACRSEQKL